MRTKAPKPLRAAIGTVRRLQPAAWYRRYSLEARHLQLCIAAEGFALFFHLMNVALGL